MNFEITSSKLANLSRQVSLRSVVLPDDEVFLIKVYSSTRDDIKAAPLLQEQKNALILHQYAAQKRYYAINFPASLHDIVLLGKESVGRLWVRREINELHIVDISLLTEFRSAGIGTMLLQRLLNEAAEANQNFSLRVWKTNPALRLYQRLGMLITEETETHFELGRPSTLKQKH